MTSATSSITTSATTLRPPATLHFGYYANLARKETRYEFLKLLRTRAFSLSTIGFPIMFYLLFGVTNRHAAGLDYARYLLASYSCFGMIGASLFGLGAGISTERAQGWLEVKLASPMPRAAYLLAKTLSCIAFALIILALLIAIGTTMAGVSLSVLEVCKLALITIAGAIPFASMGLLLAFLVPANAAPGIINLIYLPMSFCSGLWMPISVLPHWLQTIAPALPAYHYAQLALGTLGYAAPGHVLLHWEALLGFTCLMLGGVWLAFARMESRA